MDDADGFNELPELAIRMDEALEALGENAAMVLSELNGYLCGILTSPEVIPDDEWLREIWDSEDDNGPFESLADANAFKALVRDYKKSIDDELSGETFEPIYDIDAETEEVIWEIWAIGFSRAMDLRIDSWNAYLESSDEEVSEALMNLMGLVAIADPEEESEAVSEEDLAEVHEAAPDIIPYAVLALYHGGERGLQRSHLDS
ncbi:YecA/YgfB family protein [Gellertiella hungarica]|uniref:YecA family protein n=1 Tax=Gellertiella hungarica TaxID=1572859 RepID=A0A7W6NLH0_9HYPH|nr:YecA family protein [Gellertiella hungarica]MBB4065559.1 uncharacterized protein [Gellertiella hungarica]